MCAAQQVDRAARRQISSAHIHPHWYRELPEGRTLWVFYSSIGDRPERILRARVDLGPEWREWKAVDPSDVLRPKFDREGAGLPPRDSAYFVDEDGRRYLAYAVTGESGLTIAELARPTRA